MIKNKKSPIIIASKNLLSRSNNYKNYLTTVISIELHQSSLLIGSDDLEKWQLFTRIKKGSRDPFGIARLLSKKLNGSL